MKYPLADLEDAVAEAGFRNLPVSVHHALAIAGVDMPHADPFDCLLLALCQIETLRLLTADKLLADLPVAVRA